MKYKTKEEFEKANMFGEGFLNEAFAKYFIGDSYINPLLTPDKAPLLILNVTFEPGTRNNWHAHNAKSGGGQILICTAGEGWYQEDGEEAISLQEGSVINIPTGVKHWHGAKADSWFSHVAIELPGIETSNDWFEAVDDEYYAKL